MNDKGPLLQLANIHTPNYALAQLIRAGCRSDAEVHPAIVAEKGGERGVIVFGQFLPAEIPINLNLGEQIKVKLDRVNDRLRIEAILANYLAKISSPTQDPINRLLNAIESDLKEHIKLQLQFVNFAQKFGGVRVPKDSESNTSLSKLIDDLTNNRLLATQAHLEQPDLLQSLIVNLGSSKNLSMQLRSIISRIDSVFGGVYQIDDIGSEAHSNLILPPVEKLALSMSQTAKLPNSSPPNDLTSHLNQFSTQYKTLLELSILYNNNPLLALLDAKMGTNSQLTQTVQILRAIIEKIQVNAGESGTKDKQSPDLVALKNTQDNEHTAALKNPETKQTSVSLLAKPTDEQGSTEKKASSTNPDTYHTIISNMEHALELQERIFYSNRYNEITKTPLLILLPMLFRNTFSICGIKVSRDDKNQQSPKKKGNQRNQRKLMLSLRLRNLGLVEVMLTVTNATDYHLEFTSENKSVQQKIAAKIDLLKNILNKNHAAKFLISSIVR